MAAIAYAAAAVDDHFKGTEKEQQNEKEQQSKLFLLKRAKAPPS